MTAFVLSRDHSLKWSNDFDAVLEMSGMPRISRWLVFKHQVKTVIVTNPGWWLLLHLSLVIISKTLQPVISVFCAMFNIKREDDDFWQWNAGVFFLLYAVGGLALYLSHYTWIGVIMVLPVVLGALWLVLSLMFPDQGTRKAMQSWSYLPASVFFKREPGIPAHIRERHAKLKRLRGIKLYVLAFASDPFLVAVEKSNRPWLFKRKVVIGAWETGTELDQI